MLEVLVRHDVTFIVVGGVCATFHGAPIMTFDLDIVHRRDRALPAKGSAPADAAGGNQACGDLVDFAGMGRDHYAPE